MKGKFCRVFLILSLAILVVSLPAQAAHGGQAGSSSPVSDHGTQVNVSSGLSAGTSPEYAGEAPGIDTGRSISSQSFARTGPEVTASGTARDSPGTPSKSMEPGSASSMAKSSPPAGLPGDTAGRSDPGNNERAETAGGTGSSRGTGGDAAGVPDARGQSQEPGRLAGMMAAQGGAVVARSAYGSGTGTVPAPGASHGPSPQRQQHGPPAQSGGYPCGPAPGKPAPSGTGPDQGRVQRRDSPAAKVPTDRDPVPDTGPRRPRTCTFLVSPAIALPL